MRLVDHPFRGALERALWAFTAVLPVACGGSSGSDEGSAGCVTVLCLSTGGGPGGDPSGDPSGDPTDTGVDTEPDGPPVCTDCGAEQVCIQGVCTDVPDMCPCPVETYCNLAMNKCVIGCTNDDECDEGRICDADKRECFVGCREDVDCGKGKICEGLACIAGCRDDNGCDTPGHICDAMMCRPGCYADEDCPLEQLCDIEAKACYDGCNGIENCGAGKICKAGVCQVGCLDNSWCGDGEICKADQCTPGCADSNECGPGKACLDGKCVDGCKLDTECSLGQVCIDTKCTAGCGQPGGSAAEADSTRCQYGKSCQAVGCTNGANCAKFECTDACDGETCHSSGNDSYICYGDDLVDGYCMEECFQDADCAGGEVCAMHAYPPSNPNTEIGLCRTPCSTNADCAGLLFMGSPWNCNCKAGACQFEVMLFPFLCTYDDPENK